MENRRGRVVLRRQYRRLPQGADAGWAVPDFEGYLLLKPAMHPPGGFAAITGLRSPHHVAHAEACLHSATAAPAPSRCIRRRRRSTPQPLTGEPSQTAAARKASPARGGGCAVRRRRRGAAPCPANILLGRRILSAAAALRRAGSCCALKDTHAAKRQCTPQAASPPLPVCGPRIMRRTLKRACILRPLRYREAVKTGAVSD